MKELGFPLFYFPLSPFSINIFLGKHNGYFPSFGRMIVLNPFYYEKVQIYIKIDKTGQ